MSKSTTLDFDELGKAVLKIFTEFSLLDLLDKDMRGKEWEQLTSDQRHKFSSGVLKRNISPS